MAVSIFGASAGSVASDAAKGIADAGKNALADVADALKKIGEVVASIVPGAETLVGALKGIGEACLSALGKVADFGKSVVGAFSSLLGEKVTGALTAFGKSLGSLGAVAGIAGGGMVALGLALGQFVAKANPAVFAQFQLALDDLMAVIGQAVVPIFQSVVIPVVRMFADMLMNLAPIGAAFAQAIRPLVGVFGVVFEVVGHALAKVGEIALKLSPAFEAIGEVFLELVKAVEPIYDLLIDLVGGVLVEVAGALASAIKSAMPVIIALTQVIGDMVKFVVRSVRELLAMIGINLPETPGVKPGASVGAAVRSASHMGVEEATKAAQVSAFSLGNASKEDPAKATAGYAAEIKARTDEIYRFLTKDLPTIISELPGKLATAIRGAADKTLIASGLPPTSLIEAAIKNPVLTLQVAGREAARTAEMFGGTLRDGLERQMSKPGVFGYTSWNPLR